jgi:DNA-binding NarL/FixJ family response regulator
LKPNIAILVVDDDVPTRVGLKTILASEPDIDVVAEASTGTEAIALARALEPDIVLMDVQLPDLDGITATRRIVAHEPNGAQTPRVVVLTTFDYDEYVFRTVQAGASGFLLKRTRAEDLVEAVRTVAEGNALPMPATTRGVIEAFARPRGPSHRLHLLERLTGREYEVLVLIARGLSNHEIADRLGLSVETVRTHVKRVYMKCDIRDRAQAVIVAYESGLISRSV